MTPKPKYDDEFHKEQRKRMQASRGFSQNQQDLINYLKKGGRLAVQGKQIKTEDYTFRAQRNTITSLLKRGLLECKHEDGWDVYTLKEEST